MWRVRNLTRSIPWVNIYGCRSPPISLPMRPPDRREALGDHGAAVGALAAAFAECLGWSDVLHLAGQLHDIGKLSPEFQDYIAERRSSGGDHSSRWVALKARLIAEIDAAPDSLRFYRLGAEGRRRVEHVGAKPVQGLGGPSVFGTLART